jgi:hypothetical protein
VDIPAVKTSQETLADTKNDFHEELDHMFQVEARTMKAEVRINGEGIKPGHEEVMAIKKAGQGKIEAMMEACSGKSVATDLEANPEEIESESVHHEVPEEEAAVETIRVLEYRYGDRHIAVGRRRQSKKWTQGDGGSRKKLAAARRRMTRHTVPARRKGRGHRGPTVERRRRKGSECNNGIRDEA